MHPYARKELVGRLWPRHSTTIEQVNTNAQMLAKIREYERKSIQSFTNRIQMYSAVNEFLTGVAISYLEFGVWKGKSLKAWTEINANAESRFYGFDSFEGLPEEWSHGFGRATAKGEFDVNGAVPQFADSRVKFFKGWFQHTLRGFLDGAELLHPIVVHIDCDLHSSALYVLAMLDSFLKKGDVVMFDEYNSPCHEYLAWEEYKSAFMREAECIAMSDRWRQAAFLLG
jgi:O-methyltransferase